MRDSNGAAEGTVWVVEAWRGVAAWMVVYAHFGSGAIGGWHGASFAFTGVDLFFVLSGFVFAPYLFGKALAPMAFWTRRFFRIYPAYLLALVGYVAMKASSGAPLLHVWEHLSFTYLQSPQMAFYYNPVFWSLPSEVEFYLLLPLLAWGCRGRLWLLALLLLGALGMRAALGFFSDRGLANAAFMVMHHLPGLLIEFLLGAVAWRWGRSGWGLGARAVVGAAGLALWLSLAHWFGLGGDVAIDAGWARGQLGWLAALAFALMVAASAGRWEQAPLVAQYAALWAGRLSFGVYLFHMAALHGAQKLGVSSEATTTALAVVATLVMSWACYWWWEEPWRRFGRTLADQNTSVSPG